MKHIVQMSGGVGSWATARVVKDKHVRPGDELVILFADVLIEDKETYEFLDAAAADIGVPITRIVVGVEVRSPSCGVRSRSTLPGMRAFASPTPPRKLRNPATPHTTARTTSAASVTSTQRPMRRGLRTRVTVAGAPGPEPPRCASPFF